MALLLCIAMLVGLLPPQRVHAAETEISPAYTEEDEITYSYNTETFTLTISGAGDMRDYVDPFTGSK